MISGGDNNTHHNDHHNNLGISAIKMKKIKAGGGRTKVREPRFCFNTLIADIDILDDGYNWRK